MKTKAFSHENRADGTDVWLTPRSILQPLGEFDLDPCAAPEPRPWPTAVKHIVEAENGLTRPWTGRVWCNPPYKGAAPWLKKMAQHNCGLLLIFVRTETAAWHEHIWPHASAMLFLKGRLTFFNKDGTKPDNSAGAPSVLISFGDEDANCLWYVTQHRMLEGAFVDLRGGRTAP